MTVDELKKKHPGAVTFTFGDSAWMNDELLGLVVSGRKTATCAPARDYEADPAAMPVVGRRDIATRWDGTPAAVIETTEITHHRYCDVPEDFALAEGEADTFEGWQRDQRVYFERNGGFSEDMMLVCERFKLVEIL
ncbi:MAG: ASCH domain-containing protein [Pseudomonadota bacterium]